MLDAAPQVAKVIIQQEGDLLLRVGPMGRFAERRLGHGLQEVETHSHRGSEDARPDLRIGA